MNAPATVQAPGGAPRRDGAPLAWQMLAADLLKLRKKRSTLIWALVLALGPQIVFFAVRAAQHSSNPAQYSPAGGLGGFDDGLRLLAIIMGPLAAILIGAEAGAGDSAAGVFRDLVVTGRSRLALFASRLPAALALCWTVLLAGYALLLIGTFAFAGSAATPGGALLAEAMIFTLFATGVVCAVAVGFASLTTSRPATITALIGWQLVASPLLATIDSLGSAREALLSQALIHFCPVLFSDRSREVAMSMPAALVVIAAWLGVFLALGARRTRTMDA
jgi:ABC-type transport system involved in multi-copper enzyme maturation permease subunit